MSEILTAVSEMSQVLLKVREVSGENILSGKSGLKLFIVSCIFTSILDFALLSFCISFWFPTPTTDNNISTGMI